MTWFLLFVIGFLIYLIKLQRTEIYKQVGLVDSLQRNLAAEKIKYITKEKESEEYQKLFKNAMEEVKIAEIELDNINKDIS
tara:strand:- start:1368 stop:1610 length:243 start_codon:yes stop_codon:yes gene_type:complete